ncbi:Sugar (and other) transporter [Ceratobasidium sp. AG-Ba]|nr:Sugar (and other) transporter [Ceratobasidium sp. AG-Ba]
MLPAIDGRDVVSVGLLAFASLGGFIMGFDTSVISGIKELPAWLERFGYRDEYGLYRLTTANESLVVSILSAGTFFGALTSGIFADNFGRRAGIIASSILFSAGVAIQVGSPNLAAFVVGRAITGYGLGAMLTFVPMYQSECAQKSIRGAIITCSQLSTTIGLMIAAVANQSASKVSGASSWRVPIAIQIAFAGVLALGMIFLPESPRYYVKRNRREEGLRALSRLRQRPTTDLDVIEEFDEIVKSAELDSAMSRSGYLDCFKQGAVKTRTRVLTGLGFLGAQQLTGINFIFYYGTTFFVSAGISDPYLISVLANVVNVVFTLPAFVLIDKVGRRPLLIWGALWMAIAQLIIGATGITVSTDNEVGQRVLVAFVFLYVAAFALTWGPVAWVVNAELYPLAVRAKAMSMTGATNWAVNFGIGYSVPYLVNEGPGNAGLGVRVYFLWGSLCMLCFVYAYFFIPETKGLSLEQVDQLFLNSTPRTSSTYRAQLLATPHSDSTPEVPYTLRHSTSATSSDPEKSEKQEI